jgi:dihydroflavonol-4-reductase
MSSQCSLVTGANGFLGARLVRKLVERGERVKALVRTGSDLRELADLPSTQVRIAVGDVRMTDRVYAALSGCDRMYHVAATHSFDETKRTEILQDSIEGTESALFAARYAGIARIVVTGSVAALGISSNGELLDENSVYRLGHAGSYTGAKHVADAVVRRHAEAGLPVVSVLPSILIGPGDARPTPMGRRLIAYLERSPSVRFPVSPGGFCFADVDDVADGHILAMERGRVGERYILGGENLTNRQLVELLSEVSGLAEAGHDIGRTRAKLEAHASQCLSRFRGGSPLLSTRVVDDYFGKTLFVDDSKARMELGYAPRKVRIALARACHWFLDHGYVHSKASKRARLEILSV